MRTYRRLMGFLRPYRLQLWGSLAFAWAAMGMTVLIPWLVGRAINAIEDGNKPDLLPLALVILGAAILRMGLTVVRRLVAGKVSLAVEFDLRQLFYAHLQKLELGFFDTQQTGQLMSRATVDLGAIRFFLGYGLIFITQNLLTIVLASTVMFIINPLLAALALIPAPFVVWIASRYNRISRPAVQEVAQRVAELTAEAEENVSGIRIVKAFAREEFQLHRFQRAVKRVFDQSIYSTRLQAFFSPLIGLLPQLGIALVLLIGGRMVIDGNLSLGNFTAFYTYLVMLAGPLRMLGVAMGMAQRAVASGNRMFEIIDREPTIQSPADPVELPADGGGRVELRDVTLRYAAAPSSENEAVPALHDVSLEVDAGQDGGAGRALGLRQDEPGGADRAAVRPERGHGRGRRRRRARRRPDAAALGDRLRRRRQLPLHRQRRRQHRLRPRRRPPARRSKRRRAWPRPTASSANFPTATTPASASAASPSPAASASGWRSPAPCSPTRAS